MTQLSFRSQQYTYTHTNSWITVWKEFDWRYWDSRSILMAATASCHKDPISPFKGQFPCIDKIRQWSKPFRFRAVQLGNPWSYVHYQLTYPSIWLWHFYNFSMTFNSSLSPYLIFLSNTFITLDWYHNFVMVIAYLLSLNVPFATKIRRYTTSQAYVLYICISNVTYYGYKK